MTARGVLVRLHRWVGLGIAGFLAVVGLTGAAIAWNDAGERLFAPSLFVLPAAAAARPAMDPFALRDAAARAFPAFAVDGVGFVRERDAPERFFLEARPGGPAPRNDEVALDPSTGAVVGARHYGDLRQGAVNLMPFLYQLHAALALGSGGAWVLGVVALMWTLDCFVGFVLTFPARARPRRTPGPWAARWGRAWRVRWPTRPFKLTFDLHSAVGLWLWPMLAVLAWSGVAFNLQGVYAPVTRAVLGMDSAPAARIAPAPAARPPGLDWRAAHAAAVAAMDRQAARDGFKVQFERLMFYDPAARTYAYRVRSTLDVGKLGDTQLTLDADDGRVLGFSRPTGGRLGTTFTTWIEELHTAGVFGWPMQAFLTLTGLGVASLSVTGVAVWLRKRKRKRRGRPSRRLQARDEANSSAARRTAASDSARSGVSSAMP